MTGHLAALLFWASVIDSPITLLLGVRSNSPRIIAASAFLSLPYSLYLGLGYHWQIFLAVPLCHLIPVLALRWRLNWVAYSCLVLAVGFAVAFLLFRFGVGRF